MMTMLTVHHYIFSFKNVNNIYTSPYTKVVHKVERSVRATTTAASSTGEFRPGIHKC